LRIKCRGDLKSAIRTITESQKGVQKELIYKKKRRLTDYCLRLYEKDRILISSNKIFSTRCVEWLWNYSRSLSIDVVSTILPKELADLTLRINI
jgi:hypothetical protein